nr:protein MEMO1 [Cryptococcus depauperatus CBS 7841]
MQVRVIKESEKQHMQEAGTLLPSKTYSLVGSDLKKQLAQNLDAVKPISNLDFHPPVVDGKAIIAPHAGYSYSGPAAAWAYASVPTDRIKRVFLLGPSHHAYIPGVALSKFEAYDTPLGEIPLDLATIDELRKTNIFSDMKSKVDEEEHSLEMHLPYIRFIFKEAGLKLIPILVGHLDATTSQKLSEVLSKYWDDKETFFIISSDFCHWGSRFSCTPYYSNPPPLSNSVPPVTESSATTVSAGTPELIRRFSPAAANPEFPIWRSIQYMDHEGIEILRKPGERGAVQTWELYLERTKNTICGRNPITVLLNLVQYFYKDRSVNPEFTFVRYEQSSKCMTGKDSSVSYVSGILRVPM